LHLNSIACFSGNTDRQRLAILPPKAARIAPMR
jgi:hypothetical protein